MEVFRELAVDGTEDQILALIEAATERLPAGWIRDTEAEAKFTPLGGSTDGSRGFAFSRRNPSEEKPAAGVFLLFENEEMKIINIVPLEKSQLSVAEYNQVLEELEASALHPAARALGLSVRMTSPTAGPADWMSPEAADLLKRFSILANMSTGGSHPLDRRRWHDFIIATHGERSRLDASTLERILIEVHGWPLDRASDLASEYETARELLKDYDES